MFHCVFPVWPVTRNEFSGLAPRAIALDTPALSHHFVSIGLNLAKQIDVKPEDDFLKHITPVGDKTKCKAIDERYVLNAISRLEKGNASGPDKLSVTFVQDAAKSISYTLALIYNSSSDGW